MMFINGIGSGKNTTPTPTLPWFLACIFTCPLQRMIPSSCSSDTLDKVTRDAIIANHVWIEVVHIQDHLPNCTSLPQISPSAHHPCSLLPLRPGVTLPDVPHFSQGSFRQDVQFSSPPGAPLPVRPTIAMSDNFLVFCDGQPQPRSSTLLRRLTKHPRRLQRPQRDIHPP